MQTCERGTPATCGSPPHPSQEVVMILLVVAAVLVVLWLLGLVAFHVTAFAIHLLLIAAVIAVIAHFAMGKRSGRPRVCPPISGRPENCDARASRPLPP